MNSRSISKILSRKKQKKNQPEKILSTESINSSIILIDDSVPNVELIQKRIKAISNTNSSVEVINLGVNERDEFVQINIKKKNILGKLPKFELQKVIGKKCDLLINFIESDDLAVEYIAAIIDAKLKVFKSINLGMVYDLNIKLQENSSDEYFIEQLFFYLSSLNSSKS